LDRGHLKQRIVGAIVLVALGVIFIPMILNREDSTIGISGTNIPPKPKQLEQLATQPIQPAPPAATPPAETTQLVDKETPPLPKAVDSPVEENTPAAKPPTSRESNKDKPSTPVITAKSTGWVVQVASFSDRNKALQLRDRLRKAKYTCFVESTTGKRGTLYRVRVGPVVKREEADKLQTRLARQLKLKGTLVMSHP
jgi:DedD protein